MLDSEKLKDWLHDDNISVRDKLLLTIAAGNQPKRMLTTIIDTAYNAGWDEVGNPLDHRTIELHDIYKDRLKRETKGYAIGANGWWELNSRGKEHVRQLVATLQNQPAAIAASTLRDVLDGIPNENVREFVREAVRNVEHEAYRSAVVLSWCGAIALLRDHVLNDSNLLAAFNAEVKKNNRKWKDAKVADDFGRMKEYEFVQVLHAVSIRVDKNLKHELEAALKLRNSCGHPNSLIVGKQKVLAHVEMLAENVFAKFG